MFKNSIISTSCFIDSLVPKPIFIGIAFRDSGNPANSFSFSASVTGYSDDARRQIIASLYSEKSKSWYLLMDFPPYL